MRLLFTAIGIFLFIIGGAFAFEKHEVKKGQSPFMAFIYYSDETVVTDDMDHRFVQSAVLLKPDWLVTATFDLPSEDNTTNLAQNTLLARTGAVKVDKNFTLNEDEGEQEREVVDIVNPYQTNASLIYDILLLRTIEPFKITPIVKTAHITFDEFSPKHCKILIFAVPKRNSNTRQLMQFVPEPIVKSKEVCGSEPDFLSGLMACTTGINNTAELTNICDGNSGGPLLCDNKLVGTQTYVDNKCQPPYYYQLFSGWKHFIECTLEAKCEDESCSNTCVVTNKDSKPKLEKSLDQTVDGSENGSINPTLNASEDEQNNDDKKTEELGIETSVSPINETETTVQSFTEEVMRTDKTEVSEETSATLVINRAHEEAVKLSPKPKGKTIIKNNEAATQRIDIMQNMQSTLDPLTLSVSQIYLQTATATMKDYQDSKSEDKENETEKTMRAEDDTKSRRENNSINKTLEEEKRLTSAVNLIITLNKFILAMCLFVLI